MFFLTKLCFLCLRTYKNLKLVLIDDIEGTFIQPKINYCLPEIAVGFHSKTPKYICRNCISTLECLYRFKQTCLRNDAYLKNYLQILRSADKSYKYLSVRLTDLKYQNTLEDNGIKESHSEENNIVKEELITYDDKIDVEFYRDFVKSIKCESISSDSDDSISRTEDIVQENSEINSTNHEKKKIKKYIRKKERFECAICNRIFLSKKALKYHLKVHAGIKDFKCSICQKSFRNRSSLTHHKKIHPGVNFECRICSKKFMYKDGLNLHAKSHEGVKNFECGICSKKFMRRNDLKRHEMIHSNIKNYECSKCEKKFKQKHNMLQHEKNHEDVKNFECGICAKKFMHKGVLNRHEKIHANIKNYECSKCEKKFTQKHYLVRHEKLHTDVKYYECSKCDKIFATKWYLLQHERSHAGVKNFECVICSKKFIRKSVLNRHKKIHEDLKNLG